MKFNHDYEVISLECILAGTYDANSVRRSRDVRILPGAWQFPCRQMLEEARLKRLVSTMQAQQTDFDVLLELVDENQPHPEAEPVDVGSDAAALQQQQHQQQQQAERAQKPDGRDLPGYKAPNKGSSRPPHIHQHLWYTFSPQQRAAEAAAYAEQGDPRALAVQDIAAAVSRLFAAVAMPPAYPPGKPSSATSPYDVPFVQPPLVQVPADWHLHEEHREKHPNAMPLNVYGLVTRLLTRKDPEFSSPKALAALLSEVDKLLQATVWDKNPVEMSQAKADFPAANFSRLFYILGIKSWELGEQLWKYKARIVVQGNQVRTSSGEPSFFQDTSSAPTSMAAIRAVIAYGCMNGGCSQTDAEAAFVQPELSQEEVYFVHIPTELCTEEMRKKCSALRAPVFRLRRPLYGLPRSGQIWERFLESKLLTLNWHPVPDWPQTFIKQNIKTGNCVLTVYVDDFIVAGPNHLAELDAIRGVIKTTPPTDIGRVLGVQYSFTTAAGIITQHANMVDYSKQAIDMYNSVSGAPKLKPNTQAPWVDPADADYTNAELMQKGIFAEVSASLLMKALYLARMVRVDLCWVINTLSRSVTRWSVLNDRQMHRVYSYLYTVLEVSLQSTINPKDFEEVWLEAYPDADLAGARDCAKSTSGGIVFLAGPRGTQVALDWYSKKQSATSHSTTESELVSCSKMLREHLLPQITLWEAMTGRSITSKIYEDNESTIKVVASGFSSQLRHLAKHHRISLSLINDIVHGAGSNISMQHVESALQRGDLLTKGLDRAKLESARALIGLLPHTLTKT